MKAALAYWHKARLQGRYVLEMEIYRVTRSAKYREGIRYGLIMTDSRTKKRVLMDNHHPKRHHIHMDDDEMVYEFVNEGKLIKDFKALVLKHMGVRI